MKFHLPPSFYNILSYIGAAIAAISTFMFIFLFVLASIARLEKAYVGIVLFIVIPAFIILGLLIIPLGMYLKVRKEKRRGLHPSRELPVLNLNIPSQRNAVIIFTLGTLVFLFLSALGSYEAYHYTESTIFCGTLCHQLMIPEYTAYQSSPHARVSCAECHVGKGANWYVKSKLSGLYQVYATLTRSYPRPIPTPIRNLRPARETCEECHWPQKVYGKQQRREIYYLADDANTRWEIDMLLNTGGGNPALGQKSGIHWHINPDIRIEYIAADAKRLEIPLVLLINRTSKDTVIYNSTASPLPDSVARSAERRTMDCIDCHNRPSHIYQDPNHFINTAMATGDIDAALPGIKQQAVTACVEEYDTDEAARQGIEEKLTAYYSGANSVDKARLSHSIAAVQNGFSHNIFPAMKVRWSEYPNHIGHLNSPGCFRCHDDQHVSNSGRTISRKCETCHLIMAQGPGDKMEYAGGQQSLEFHHPEDIGDAWKETNCSECHGTPPL